MPYKLTELDKREILRMKAEGLSEFKIAVILGVYPNTVRNFLKREAAREAERESMGCK
jgi:DNA-binding CsgD family transcriptional regulator